MRIYGGNLIKQKLYLIEPEKSIAMLQSNHRNASLVHSHIAVLHIAFFPFARLNVFSPHSEDADLYKREPKVAHDLNIPP